MQTLKNNTDATLKYWPKSLEEWDTPQPEIKFTVPRDRIVHPGDRILASTKMVTEGENSGSIVNVYYYIENIKTIAPNAVHITNTDITATASRKVL